jgi:hypothetical protein
MNEYSDFAKQQEKLSKEIAVAKTPDERKSLELRKEIEACDYMAITSERLAGMSRVITGDKNSKQAQRDEVTAAFYRDRGKELRAERAQIIEKQRADQTQPKEPLRDAATTKATITPEKKPEANRNTLRAGEQPRTVAQHEAQNRAHEEARQQREQSSNHSPISSDTGTPRNENIAQRNDTQRREKGQKGQDESKPKFKSFDNEWKAAQKESTATTQRHGQGIKI